MRALSTPLSIRASKCLSWLGVCAALAAPAGADPLLSVMTYNVLHGQPCNGGSLPGEVAPRMELAVQGGPSGEPGLAALAPDVIGLQEVSQVFRTEPVGTNPTTDNKPCLVGSPPAGLAEITPFEHAGDALVRRLDGVVGARAVEQGAASSRNPVDATPYGMRFVRDNPRVVALIPDVPLPPDEQDASDRAADAANLEIGLAVISRHRIQRVTVHNLTPDEMPGGTRALLHASIATDDGRRYDFFDSHMTTGGGDTLPTQLQAQDIIAFVQANRRHPENPGFFVCDCNANPATAAYAAFTGAGFVDSYAVANPGAAGFTSGRDGLSDDCTQSAATRIDYVFALPDDQGRVPATTASQVVMDYQEELAPGVCRFPSDHNGVLSTFDLGNLQ